MSLKVTFETDIAKNVAAQQNELTNSDKEDIIFLAKEQIKILGSARAFANRCSVSDATISMMLKNGYLTKGEDMWRKVAAAVNWNKSGWCITNTTNVNAVAGALQDAQNESMFMAISEKAGSGKSAGIEKFLAENNSDNVFRIKCRDWGRREFLVHVRIALGLPLIIGNPTLDEMLQQITHFFKMRKGRPIFIIDQANSMKPSLYSFIIHIYNECEDQLSLVLVGTENLQKEIKNGVKLGRKWYDELDSRLGRNYVNLFGNTKNDVRKICNSNGITSAEMQSVIWKECTPIVKELRQGDTVDQIKVVEDGRRIKRAIRKHLMIRALQEEQATETEIAKTA